MVVELAALEVVLDDVDVLLVLVDFVDLDYPLVGDFADDVDFFQKGSLVCVPVGELLFFETLDGILPLVGLARGQIDLAGWGG